MGAFLVDAGATILCPHGGSVTVTPTVTQVTLGGRPPLLAGDRVTIAGCAFNVSGSPSPCRSIQWQQPTRDVSFEGGAALTAASVGVCKNTAGAPQGLAVVTGYQTQVLAR